MIEADQSDALGAICEELGMSQYARFTANQACDSLGISISTLHRLRKKGSLGYLKIGKRIEFFGHHIAEFLLNSEQESLCLATKQKTEPIKSETTGYHSDSHKAPLGRSPIMTKPHHRQSAARLAKSTFKKRS